MPEDFQSPPPKLPSTLDDPRSDDEEGYQSPLHTIPSRTPTCPPGPVNPTLPQPVRRRTWGGQSTTRATTFDTLRPRIPIRMRLKTAITTVAALRVPEVPVGKPPTISKQLQNIAFGTCASY